VIAEAVRALDALAVEVDDLGLRRPTLDEVFLTLTGSPIDGDADEGDDSDEPTSIDTDLTTVPTTDERFAARAA
jgi:ABC-2 type transport system ATP-binding protein